MEKKTRIIFGVILACVLLAGAVAALITSSLANTPDFSELKQSVTVQINLGNGKTGMRQVGPKAPGWVPLSQISKFLVSAVVASEDNAFFQHEGLDFHEIKESIKKDIQEQRFARGGSTITQQLIKNVYLSRQKTLWRKIKEMIWAGQLEKTLTKSQILAFYMNLIEWGPGIYGVKQAAEHYFGVNPADLTPKQAAFLAMLIPSPVRRYSYFRNKQLTHWAERRVAQILRIMNRMSLIDSLTYQEALAESLWGESPSLSGAEGDENLGQTDKDVPQDMTPVDPFAETSESAPVSDMP